MRGLCSRQLLGVVGCERGRFVVSSLACGGGGIDGRLAQLGDLGVVRLLLARELLRGLGVSGLARGGGGVID